MPHNTFKQKSSSRPGYGGSSTQVKNKKSVKNPNAVFKNTTG